jgi:hypothetical protein
MQASQPITPTIMAAMFGWPLIIFLVFLVMPPRRAVIFSFLAGWMFLPDVVFDLTGLPDYGKMMAATVGAAFGAMAFDTKTVFSYRPSWADTPMIIWCLCPFASSMANGLGVYDGASGVFQSVAQWGLPYMLGRVYLRDFEAFRELAVMLFVAGLVYTPLCLFEIRMSPQLNKLVYGFGNVTGGGEYSKELGSWGSRPRVFMGTGLALGTFMTAASLMGVWLWYTGALKRLHGYAVGPLVALLVFTTFACKNMGALSLLIFGLAALFSIRFIGRSVLIYALILAAPAYMGFRASGSWSAESMVELASMVHEKRGMSLNGRLVNDTMLAEKALERPVFGWGGWGRSRIYDENGKDISVTDGLWIITIGTSGLVGLAAITAALLVPPTMLVVRYPARLWLDPRVAPAGAAAVLVVLYMIDNLFNSMFNPVYVMAAAGLVSVVVCRARINPVPARRLVLTKTFVRWGSISYENPSL